MTGSDWAGRMTGKLEREFGTSHDRNLRITGMVRWFASDPRYKPLSEDIPAGRRPDEWELLRDDLPRVLREQPGETIEERWNDLMDELGYPELVDEGVYLFPWEYFDPEIHQHGVVKERP